MAAVIDGHVGVGGPFAADDGAHTEQVTHDCVPVEGLTGGVAGDGDEAPGLVIGRHFDTVADVVEGLQQGTCFQVEAAQATLREGRAEGGQGFLRDGQFGGAGAQVEDFLEGAYVRRVDFVRVEAQHRGARLAEQPPAPAVVIRAVFEAVLRGLDEVARRHAAGRQGSAYLFFLFGEAEDDGTPVLHCLQGRHPAQKVADRWRLAGRRAAGGLGVGNPVEVFEVKTEDLGDGPGGLGQVDHAIQRQGCEQLAGEFLVVEGREAEGRTVSSLELGLGQDRCEAAVDVAACRGKEGQHGDALGAFELGGDGRYCQAAWRVRVAQADDVEEQLFLGGALDGFVVLQAGLVEGGRADAGAAGEGATDEQGETCRAEGDPDLHERIPAVSLPQYCRPGVTRLRRRPRRLFLVSLDGDDQADFIADRRDVLGHAEFRALEAGDDVGAAGFPLVEGVGGAVEAGQGEGDRLRYAEEGQTAFGGHWLVAVKAQAIGLEGDGREFGGIEEAFAAHVVVPLGKAHVDGGGVDAYVHRAAAGCDVQHDLAARLVEASALGRETQVVGLEQGKGVVGVDGVVHRRSKGRGAQGDEQGKGLFQGESPEREMKEGARAPSRQWQAISDFRRLRPAEWRTAPPPDVPPGAPVLPASHGCGRALHAGLRILHGSRDPAWRNRWRAVHGRSSPSPWQGCWQGVRRLSNQFRRGFWGWPWQCSSVEREK